MPNNHDHNPDLPVDLDALDTVLATDDRAHVTFYYDGHEVTVHADHVTVQPLDRA